MTKRTTSIVTPVAHLVGPGKIKVINGRLAFSTGKATPVRLDPTALKTVLCYGAVGVTDEAMRMLLNQEIEVAFLTPHGHRCTGRLVRADPSTTGLRLLQHLVLANPTWKMELARRMVQQKIKTQIQAARHYQRQGCGDAGTTLERLRQAESQCADVNDLDVLRGVEGTAAAVWFELLGRLFVPPWQFTRRNRRPPRDPVNALLSLGYTWLMSRMVARAEALGLEVALGALHEFRHGRPALACDLIEPLRIPAVDRWVVQLLNQQHMTADDFQPQPDGAVFLQKSALARCLAQFEDHWTNDGPEMLLHEALQDFIRELRKYGKQLPVTLPGPSEEEENEQQNGTGNDASD